MPAGGEYRRGRGSSPDRRYIVIFGVLVLAFAGVVAAALYYQSQTRSLDPLTGCPRSGSPDGITIILVDVSDSLSLSQRLALENRFGALKATRPSELADNDMPPIKPLERVELYLTAGQPLEDRPSPLVAACNPGGEDDASSLTSNLPLVRQRWTRAFAEPFTKAVDAALTEKASDKSYILASVQIAVQMLRRPEYAGVSKRLILVSDLLENSDTFNFYNTVPEPEKMLESNAFLALRTDFTGIDVDIWFLRRPSEKVDWRKVLALWHVLLKRQGVVTTIDVAPIDG